MVRLPDALPPQQPVTGGAKDAAGAMLANGLHPIPLVPKKKAPIWGEWQNFDTADRVLYERRIRRAFAEQPNANLGVRCDNLVIVDEDNEAAADYWRERLGDLYDTSTAWMSRKGRKTAYLLPPGESVKMWPSKGTYEFDVKSGALHQVVVPPSVYRDSTGEYPYAWLDEGAGVRDWSVLVELTPEQCELFRKPEVTAGERRERRERRARGEAVNDGTLPETLEELLELPGEQRGNLWLTAVCGHLAKRIEFYDAYRAIVRAIDTWSVAQGGQVEAQQEKTIRSVWKLEGERRAEEQKKRQEFAGNLVKRADGMWTELEKGQHLWLNCQLTPLLIIDADGRRYYQLELDGPRGRKVTTVEAWRLNDTRERARFLAGYGYEVSPPQTKCETIRLLEHLENQGAPAGEAVPYLGWHTDAGFLGDQGMVIHEGHRALAPLPSVVQQAAHVYGQEATETEALEFLQEVRTFQDPTVAAVGLSWWAMTLLRGRFISSVFPILLLDAVSESGKTNGLFAFLVAAAGNTRGSGVMTYPQLRNQVASVQNGIAWIDDISSIKGPIKDLLRQAPTQGTLTKTGADNTTSEEFHLKSAILVSCEGLDLTEKAMRDRVVTLKLPPVSKRRSLKGDYPQWNDVVALREKFGGEYSGVAERLAGTAVRLVHRQAHRLEHLSGHRHGGSGRHTDKLAVIRMGAEIVHYLLDWPEAEELVARWCDTQRDGGQANYFWNEILPWLLRRYDYDARREEDPTLGVARVDGVVYVSTTLAADEWMNSPQWRTDDRAKQLGTAQAIGAELRAMGFRRVDKKIGGVHKKWYQLGDPEGDQGSLLGDPPGDPPR